MTHTQRIFTPGRTYRVLASFPSGPTTAFRQNDLVVFERDAYSPYDNSFVYVFRDPSTGGAKEWWLAEETAPEEWMNFFAPEEL